MLKKNYLQDLICTSMDDDIIVTIKNFYLYIPILIPSVETQLMSNEATQNNYKISFDDYYTERQVVSDMFVQHDIGSAKQVNKPKYLTCSHQTKHRTSSSDKKIKIAIFDNLDLRKHHVEIDSIRYPRKSLLINFEKNDYIAPYKDLKKNFEEYIGVPLINPFISYPDMKTKYHIEIINLRHQPDHIKLKEIQLFREYGTDLDNARFFLV